MSIEMAALVPHTPRMCFEEKTPEFQKELVKGMKRLSGMIEKIQPDAVVMISCHWTSSFDHLVDAAPDHRGVLTALECPNLISDVPYSYPGDNELAVQLAEAGVKGGLPVIPVNDPVYCWDYGTVVPLRYLVPKGDIPVIDLSVTLAANLEETFLWGQLAGRVLKESGKKTVFISSGALSHHLVRGPECMPTLAEQALDAQFLTYLTDNDLVSAKLMLPQYAKNAGLEAGGRHIAMLLGVLEDGCKSTFYGYGQSSGSSNVVMAFEPMCSAARSVRLTEKDTVR
ncbi:extradiol ring-cleavage dioxygenase [Bacillus swezeyi]|uniref:Extradiol ring-cleavage dioxygenase n=1 Tax=Bacillus swezeyi TaxID=1925020 RepID=A0A1R1S186_9BACI|nr:extradiol ring-cleavage dioxygenase [Bacillus swezeyi]MEC1259215.1 extradiol ring-cleavage dioxygenase [Bacillus swezeyi]MED2927824.1 extradiol ring-cleavage dioxygenase [Bacillus swezeyi]MED2942083.1 extradiol ring-cleavage dioxygenase [Bacillus swezeyi]MED2965264.1 extradiol ring-cleavage dioxygenase [Bacillus swezeyi]MED2977630.1 extradiol ring-cleavage dioxygenase [Bacillus swezeyi]